MVGRGSIGAGVSKSTTTIRQDGPASQVMRHEKSDTSHRLDTGGRNLSGTSVQMTRHPRHEVSMKTVGGLDCTRMDALRGAVSFAACLGSARLVEQLAHVCRNEADQELLDRAGFFRADAREGCEEQPQERALVLRHVRVDGRVVLVAE
jgi:hypothetical protein